MGVENKEDQKSIETSRSFLISTLSQTIGSNKELFTMKNMTMMEYKYSYLNLHFTRKNIKVTAAVKKSLHPYKFISVFLESASVISG